MTQGAMCPSSSLRARRRLETRRLIEAAALDLFEKRGFKATTVEEIAERVGIAERTFFRYYGSKEAVLLGWHALAVEHLKGVQIAPGAPHMILRQLQARFDDFLARTDIEAELGADTLLRIQRLLARDPDLRAAEVMHLADFGASLRNQVRAGVGPGCDPLAVTLALEIFGATIRSTLGAWIAASETPSPCPLAELHRRACALLPDLVSPTRV